MRDNDSQAISITLSPTQVDAVVRAAAGSRVPGISTLITGPLKTRPLKTPLQTSKRVLGANSREEEPSPPLLAGYLPADTNDPRMSRSLLRGLAILTCFGPEQSERGIVELAGDLGMSPSTAHRYAFTLVELGLLERCPKTRKYRLPGV